MPVISLRILVDSLMCRNCSSQSKNIGRTKAVDRENGKLTLRYRQTNAAINPMDIPVHLAQIGNW